ATGALAVLTAGWGGAAFGRALAIWRDGADTTFNRISLVVEAGVALAIGAPWAVWLVGSPGFPKNTTPAPAAISVKPSRWFQPIGSRRKSAENRMNTQSVITSCIVFNSAVEYTACPIRLAGTARQYSMNAIPHAATMAIKSG